MTRTTMFKRFEVLIVRLAAFMVVVALAGFATVHAQEGEKRLVWAQALPTGCLDPALQRRLPDWGNIKNVYSSLLNHVPGSLTEVAPDLATSWEVSDDGLVYTFTLRQGVQWHDGFGEVTAEDVKYSWERLLDPATGATSNTDLRIVESMRVVDPYTFEVTLRQPSPSFLPIIANSAYVYVVNQQAIEERGSEHCVRPIGSGPYRVAQADVGGGVLLEAVDADHHLGRPAIKWVELRIIPEESVAVLGLIRGDLDFIFVRDYANKARLATEPGVALNLNLGFENSTYMASVNNEREPFNDVRVRQALLYGTDRATFATALTEGMVTEPAHTVVPPSMLGFTEDPSLVRHYPFDPERARQLLAEAGYPDGFSTSIQILNTSYHPLAATLLQQMWGDIGINVEIEILELAILRERQAQGDMNITLGNLAVVDVHQVLHQQFSCGTVGAGNFTRHCNPEFDALIAAQESETNLERRAQVVREAQAYLTEEVPGIYLNHMLIATAARDTVSGMIPDVGWWRTHFYWMDIDR